MTLIDTIPLAYNEATSDIVLYAVGGGIAIIAIVFGSISGVAKTQAREKTKREIAAYVAEGSITPEDAKKIIESKEKDD
ncbi:MAG: hypothetical protein ACF8Q5_03345 [Phycisphaerales bacterium JB040]